jgi:hypothetical protein
VNEPGLVLTHCLPPWGSVSGTRWARRSALPWASVVEETVRGTHTAFPSSPRTAEGSGVGAAVGSRVGEFVGSCGPLEVNGMPWGSWCCWLWVAGYTQWPRSRLRL